MATINQVYQIINLATKQAWGKEAVQVTDTRSLIAMGDYIQNTSSAASRDVFVGALSDVIGKTIFVSRELRLDDLGISTDEFTFGGYLRKIRVKPKLTEHNTEYDLSSEEFNPFEIKKPDVSEMLFSKFGTYQLVVTVTDQQIFTAFTSESEMMAFYSLIYKQLDDCIRRGELAYDRLALANFIAEKINLQTTQPTKLHTLNILALYNTTFNKSLLAKDCYTDEDFLKFFASKIMELKGYMAEDTDVFNGSDGFNSQTPAEYLRIYVLKALSSRLNAYLYGPMYHDEMVRIDGYKEVNFWQGIKGSGNPFDVDATSKINIKLASDSTGATTVEAAGILCVMTDKDAIATCYKRPKAESWRIPTKGTQNYRSVTQMMINDLWENGLVIYVSDTADVSTNFSSAEKTIIETAFAIDVDQTQSVSSATNNSITAELAYVETATTFDMSKGHHFICFKLTSNEGDVIKVKINPTQGMGWQTLDSDGLVCAQVTENTKGFYVDVNGQVSYVNLYLTLKEA